jgi:hypothetical protein
MTTDELIAALTRETATDLEALAAERSLRWVNEPNHLQPTCAAVARRLAGERLTVSTTLHPRSPLWPKLGRIDLAFLAGEEPPIAVELKAKAGRDGLAACAWDAVKLAFHLLLGQVATGYLIAATPTSDWERKRRGYEFFLAGTFTTAELREPYLDWWQHWERPGHGYPLGASVPASFLTRPVCAEQFTVNATEWSLRAAAVETIGDEWLEWRPTLDANA